MPYPPTTIGQPGSVRGHPARTAVPAFTAAVVLLVTACAGSAEPAEQTASEPANPTEAVEPLTLNAELVRSRRDEANERLRVEVTNGGEQAVPIDGLRLVAEPYSPNPSDISGGNQINPGQTIAYRVVHGEPECVEDEPTPGPVRVEVTSGDREVTLDVGESADVIKRMLTVDCARARILDVVTIRFDTEWDVHSNGNEQTGTLLIERRDGGPPVTLAGVRNSINYTLEMIEPDSHPTLEENEKLLAVPVRSRGSRCDGHAMGDNSKPFGFSAYLSVDGGPETLVEFTADEQPDNFLRLCSAD